MRDAKERSFVADRAGLRHSHATMYSCATISFIQSEPTVLASITRHAITLVAR